MANKKAQIKYLTGEIFERAPSVTERERESVARALRRVIDIHSLSEFVSAIPFMSGKYIPSC